MKVVDIEDVYNEDKELKKEHVKQLMQWMKKQQHLPNFNELQIARFLISCNYNSEFAKKTIENNATMRTYFPEVFQNRNVASVKRTMDSVLMCLLPKQTQEGYHITLYKLIDTDPSNYDCQEYYKRMDMMSSIWTAIITTSPGQVAIIDSAGASMRHFTKLDLTIVKKYTLFLQEALPIRLKAIHMINSNAIVDKTLTLLRPLMKNEMLDLMKTHSKMESLYKYIPKEYLPNEYGGKAGTIKELLDIERRRLYDYEEYLKEEEKLIVDETKRMDKTKNVNEVFGIEGTFKKLDID